MGVDDHPRDRKPARDRTQLQRVRPDIGRVVDSRGRAVSNAMKAEQVALEVCTPIGCQLALLGVSEWPAQGRERASTHLEYRVVRQLPRCSLDPPSH